MDQYDLPQYTLTLACYPQWKHLSSAPKGSKDKGMQSVLACPVRLCYPSASYFVSTPDLTFTFYSHYLISHQGVNTTFLELSWVINSCQLLAFLALSLNLWSALSYMLYWILSKRTVSSFSKASHLICSLSPLYLKTARTYLFSISFGPS